MTTLDTTPFTALPRLSLGRMIEMADALVRGAPKIDAEGEALSPKTLRSAAALQAAVTEARAARLDRMDEDRDAAARPRQRAIRDAASNAWYALRDFLHAWRRFDPERFPQAREAQELEWSLVGKEGWSFLRLPSLDQGIHLHMLLLRMARDGLDERIDALFGPAVMEEIRRTFEAFDRSEMRMMTSQEGRTNLEKARDALRSAVRAYLSRMVNEIADAPTDRESEWLRRALAPVPATAAKVRRLHRQARRAPAELKAESPSPIWAEVLAEPLEPEGPERVGVAVGGRSFEVMDPPPALASPPAPDEA